MSKSFWVGCVIVVLSTITVGCGAPKEEKLVKEKIALMEKVAEAFEKVTDKASFESAGSEMNVLGPKLAKIDEDLTKLGPERKEAALAKYSGEWDAVTQRVAAAKETARKALEKR